MNEIKKCPFCRGDAELTIEVETDCVNATIRCSYCDIIFRFIVPLSEYKTINEAVDDVLTMALERWNKRAEEPHKESRVEQILKRTIFPNKPFCTLAYNDKHGKGCKDLDCCECEFNNVTETAKYLLAPHED